MKFLLPLLAMLLLNSCVGAPNPKKIAADNEVHLKAEGIERLHQGDRAPAFTASTGDGQRVTIGVEAEAETLDAAEPESSNGQDETAAAEPEAQPAAAGAEPSDADAKPEEPADVLDESVDPEPSTGPYTVLFFYPADFTPNSTKHLRELSRASAALAAADVQVYGISIGTAGEHSRFAKENGITIPLLVDTGAVAELYGALAEGGSHPQRTLVGIRPDGTIGFYDRAFSHLPLDKTVLQKTGRKIPEAEE